MRGLLGASALFLASGLASADFESDWERIEIPHESSLLAHITVDLPLSHDDWRPRQSVSFNLQIQQSREACGHGNVILNGQSLPQSLVDNVSVGKGSIISDREEEVVSSWAFHCVKVNGIPDSQFMKFVINSVDGKPVQDVGFSLAFRQTQLEIINIETDLSVPDHVVANPNHEKLQPVEGEMDHGHYAIHEDLEELDYLWSQLREIQYLITEREESIRHHAKNHHQEDIANCDSLKCVVKAVAASAKHAVDEIYGRLGGDHEFDDEFDHPNFKKPKFPKFPGGKFGKPGKNHTCHGPKHGNHTHSPPHWKKPHRPLPICRYPPPPHHHGRPPPHPPHHGPEFDGPPPHWGDGPKHDMPPHNGPGFDGPPPHHGEGHHGFDERPPHHGPPDFEGPPHDREHKHMPPARPDFDDFRGDRPPHHREDGPPGPPPPGHGKFDQGPPRDHPPPPPPPPFGGRPPFHYSTFSKALQITKFTAIGFLFAFLILALHRRACTPQHRAARQARREERHRRRAYRRAVHKRFIGNLLARISGRDQDEDSMDYEEKREDLLARAEDGMSTTMSEEIEEFRNAADVVGTMVDAESTVPLSTPSTTSALLTPSTSPSASQAGENAPLMRNFETMSQIGGEELPAYEDNDGSELSSVVADGFMGAGYTPSVSDTGSVSDILGPDVKN